VSIQFGTELYMERDAKSVVRIRCTEARCMLFSTGTGRRRMDLRGLRSPCHCLSYSLHILLRANNLPSATVYFVRIAKNSNGRKPENITIT